MRIVSDSVVNEIKNIDKTICISKNDVKLSLVDKMFRQKYGITSLRRIISREYVFHECDIEAKDHISNETVILSVYVFTDSVFFDLGQNRHHFLLFDQKGGVTKTVFSFNHKTLRIMMTAKDVDDGKEVKVKKDFDYSFRLSFHNLCEIYKEKFQTSNVVILDTRKKVNKQDESIVFNDSTFNSDASESDDQSDDDE